MKLKGSYSLPSAQERKQKRDVMNWAQEQSSAGGKRKKEIEKNKEKEKGKKEKHGFVNYFA